MGFYSITNVSDKTGIKPYTLRNLEKVLDLKIKRDNMQNRIYTENDILLFNEILQLKDQGLNYDAIKAILSAKKNIIKSSEEAAVELVNTDTNLPNENAINILKDLINDGIKSNIEPKMNEVLNKLDNLETQNDTLKKQLEIQQEKHFRELDERLMKALQNKKKVSLFKKILNKLHK